MVAMIIVFCLFYAYTSYNEVSRGEQAPNFKAELIDGTPFQLSDLQGKYVLLDFWGSWCPPCRKANPKLVALHQKYPDKLTIVTVALEKDSTSWRKAADKDGFTWKNQIVDQNKFVMLSSIARMYSVRGIPSKFLISPKGMLMEKYSFAQIDSVLSIK
ncbi:hypothetical protein GCM10022393_13110 [Aquimarina addita]|uniref:Thioredoxin domain-containing protein n=2 Tax=Aquimarina addita TaxID=870485 RepID=A0ABP7XER7_9FLAO